MKVSLTETGGWANIAMHCAIDTSSLPPATARVLEDALGREELFAPHPAAPDARDARTVTIEVESESGVRLTSFSEAATPAAALVILEILRPLCTIRPAAG
jgi:hypothetical protein